MKLLEYTNYVSIHKNNINYKITVLNNRFKLYLDIYLPPIQYTSVIYKSRSLPFSISN